MRPLRCAGRRTRIVPAKPGRHIVFGRHRPARLPRCAHPFISAVVDLDGGPTLKGTLRGVEFDPSEIASGRRVKVVFNNALDRKDKDGNAYVAHHFEPI
ncbi:OB-fold domain-containing protein [Croceicoccus sp. YJ47]|nr:OB-fold domain-containing protein [Croceicoccus sp. YJ47]